MSIHQRLLSHVRSAASQDVPGVCERGPNRAEERAVRLGEVQQTLDHLLWDMTPADRRLALDLLSEATAVRWDEIDSSLSIL